MKRIFLIISALALATVLSAQTTSRPMNVTVIQPAYENGEEAAYRCHRWMIEQLDLCTPNDDIIVLPESSTHQARFSDTETCMRVFEKNYQEMIDACSRTAKRCDALVFMNGYGKTETGVRNITFAFGRDGKMIGMYPKQQLVASEWKKMKLDRSYMMEWNEPYYLDIDGLRYAFLTCYDFYYYENYSNIGRYKPDVIIGCSNQRSDPHDILSIINKFCAYNTGAYLVRASVSMGEDSPVGGCSCIVAPTGEILGNLYSKRAVLDATFDPEVKYLKPAGYGNPPSLHLDYMEIGRRPMKYRPGGSAIVPFADETASQRISALNGMKLLRKDLMTRIGAAVGAGATEVFLPVSTSGFDGLKAVLTKFSCHMILNLNLTGEWNADDLQRLRSMLFDFDVLRHLCLTSSSREVLDSISAVFPDVPRCILPARRDLSESAIAAAHDDGLRVCVLCRRRSARKLLDRGIDTAVVRNWR